MLKEKVSFEVIRGRVFSKADVAAVLVIHFDDDPVYLGEPTPVFVLFLLPLCLKRLLA